ncbi:MAG: hypothetical protein E7612_04000 [Ruminococcaceae bacterium]|nr:hypothetical protein [Oscillospiraceae bacterium]
MKRKISVILLSLLIIIGVFSLFMSFFVPEPASDYFSKTCGLIFFTIIWAFEIKNAHIPPKKVINTSRSFWIARGKPNVYRYHMTALFLLSFISAFYFFVRAIIALFS